MSFLKQILQKIEQKQSKAMCELQNNAELLIGSNQGSYFQKLHQQLLSCLQKEMDQHSRRLEQHFFGNHRNQLRLQTILDNIQQHQQHYLHQLGQQFDNNRRVILNIDTYKTIHRKTRREPVPFIEQLKEKQTVSQPNNKSPSQDISVKKEKPEAMQPIQPQSKILPVQAQLQALTVQGQSQVLSQSPEPQVKNEQKIVSDGRIGSQKIGVSKQLYVYNNKLAASDIIEKRDIVKELEERRRKLLEKNSKAKKLKSKLIKLQPIARKEDQLAKQKEAKDKITAAIDFVKGLENKKKIPNFKITEWKQDRSVKTVDKKVQSPQKYSHRKFEHFGERLQESFDEGTMGYGQSSKRSGNSVIKADKNFVLSKPIPYNLYNVNTKNEMFKLPSK